MTSRLVRRPPTERQTKPGYEDLGYGKAANVIASHLATPCTTIRIIHIWAGVRKNGEKAEKRKACIDQEGQYPIDGIEYRILFDNTFRTVLYMDKQCILSLLYSFSPVWSILGVLETDAGSSLS